MSEVREDAEEKAKRLGLDLIKPEPDQLFVDLDSDTDREAFEKRWMKLHPMWPLSSFRMVESTGGKGHYHVYVTIPELNPLGEHERIALQAALGSDYFREMLAIFHGRAGYKWTSVFFEKPAAAIA